MIAEARRRELTTSAPGSDGAFEAQVLSARPPGRSTVYWRASTQCPGALSTAGSRASAVDLM